VGRQVEQVYAIRGDERAPAPPDGVEIVSLAARPDLFVRTYRELALEAFEDMPLPGELAVSEEDWERSWVTWPEGSFVALAGGEIVGYAGLVSWPGDATRAEHGLTVVRRAWRRRGLATALKARELAWASSTGIRALVTWTQRGNEALQGVNERLGYVVRSVSVSVRKDIA
jgi:GNAT superfamily N-acetyltransferase